MSSNIEEVDITSNLIDSNINVNDSIKGTNITSNMIEEKDEKERNPYFDTNEYYHYIKIAKEQFKDVDLHLIEFAIAEYFIYTVKGIERPKEDSDDFIRAKEKIEKLIEDTRKITQELAQTNANDNDNDNANNNQTDE